MGSHAWRSRMAGWARLVLWAVGLGLVTSRLAYQTDGRGAGLMIAAACATLMWRIVVTIDPFGPRPESHRAGSTVTAPQEPQLLQQP